MSLMLLERSEPTPVSRLPGQEVSINDQLYLASKFSVGRASPPAFPPLSLAPWRAGRPPLEFLHFEIYFWIPEVAPSWWTLGATSGHSKSNVKMYKLQWRARRPRH